MMVRELDDDADQNKVSGTDKSKNEVVNSKANSKS